MQLRKSLIELEAQNVQNAVEIRQCQINLSLSSRKSLRNKKVDNIENIHKYQIEDDSKIKNLMKTLLKSSEKNLNLKQKLEKKYSKNKDKNSII